MPKEKYITRRYSKKSDAGLRSWTPEIKIIFIMHEFLQETEKMKHFCFEVEKMTMDIFPPNLNSGLMTRNTDAVIIETHIINTVSSKST